MLRDAGAARGDAGELATMVNAEGKLNADLHVIR
jgi:hypothetical protein